MGSLQPAQFKSKHNFFGTHVKRSQTQFRTSNFLKIMSVSLVIGILNEV